MTTEVTRAPAARARRRAVDPAMAGALVIAVLFVVVAIIVPVASMVGTSLSADALPVFER